MDRIPTTTSAAHVRVILRTLVVVLALAALCVTLLLDRSNDGASDVLASGIPEGDADRRLADEVRAAFMRDDAVVDIADRVTIAAHGQVVILSGRVDTVRQRDALKADARAVQGVARVDSRLIAAGD
jgi:hypothetical protein